MQREKTYWGLYKIYVRGRKDQVLVKLFIRVFNEYKLQLLMFGHFWLVIIMFKKVTMAQMEA